MFAIAKRYPMWLYYPAFKLWGNNYIFVLINLYNIGDCVQETLEIIMKTNNCRWIINCRLCDGMCFTDTIIICWQSVIYPCTQHLLHFILFVNSCKRIFFMMLNIVHSFNYYIYYAESCVSKINLYTNFSIDFKWFVVDVSAWLVSHFTEKPDRWIVGFASSDHASLVSQTACSSSDGHSKSEPEARAQSTYETMNNAKSTRISSYSENVPTANVNRKGSSGLW